MHSETLYAGRMWCACECVVRCHRHTHIRRTIVFQSALIQFRYARIAFSSHDHAIQTIYIYVYIGAYGKDFFEKKNKEEKISSIHTGQQNSASCEMKNEHRKILD